MPGAATGRLFGTHLYPRLLQINDKWIDAGSGANAVILQQHQR
jgi:hypothetical protein